MVKSEVLLDKDSSSALSTEIKEEKNSVPNWILDLSPINNSIDKSDENTDLTDFISQNLNIILGGIGEIKIDNQKYYIRLDENSHEHAIQLLQACGLELGKDFEADTTNSTILIDISTANFLKKDLEILEDDYAEDMTKEAFQKLALSSLLTRLTGFTFPIQNITIEILPSDDYQEFLVKGENLEKIELIFKVLLPECEVEKTHQQINLKGFNILAQLHHIYCSNVDNVKGFCEKNSSKEEAYQAGLHFLTKLIFGAGGLNEKMIRVLGGSNNLHNLPFGNKVVAAQNLENKTADKSEIFTEIVKSPGGQSLTLFSSCYPTSYSSKEGSPFQTSKSMLRDLDVFIKL